MSKLHVNVNDYVVAFLMDQLKGTAVCDRVMMEWKKNENQEKIKEVLVTGSTKKKKKKPKKIGPVKRRSAYMFFCKIERKILKETTNLCGRDVLKEIGKRWRVLKGARDAASRARYSALVDQSVDDGRRYVRELEEKGTILPVKKVRAKTLYQIWVAKYRLVWKGQGLNGSELRKKLSNEWKEFKGGSSAAIIEEKKILNDFRIVSAEPRAESMVEPSAEPRAESSAEPRAESMVEPRAEPRAESMVEPSAESMVEPSAESMVESMVESSAEPRAESMVEPSAEPRAESMVEESSAFSPRRSSRLTLYPPINVSPREEGVVINSFGHTFRWGKSPKKLTLEEKAEQERIEVELGPIGNDGRPWYPVTGRPPQAVQPVVNNGPRRDRTSPPGPGYPRRSMSEDCSKWTPLVPLSTCPGDDELVLDTIEDPSNMSVQRLKEELKARSITRTGRKVVLIARLKKALGCDNSLRSAEFVETLTRIDYDIPMPSEADLRETFSRFPPNMTATYKDIYLIIWDQIGCDPVMLKKKENKKFIKKVYYQVAYEMGIVSEAYRCM
jgi:hypothetical protein